jgi:transposase-like protein
MAKRNDKKDKAKALYLTGQYNQKEIASIVGVSENTLSTWVNTSDDKGVRWDDLKTSLLTTRSNELRRLYKMLQNINDAIDEKSELKIPINSKEADAVLKLTTAIKNLEIETSIAEKVDVGTEFINMVQKEEPDLAKQITKWFDIYLNQFA